MPLNLTVVEPSPRFAVDPANPFRVVIMEGDRVTVGLGQSGTTRLAEALAHFLGHALDLSAEPILRFSGASEEG